MADPAVMSPEPSSMTSMPRPSPFTQAVASATGIAGSAITAYNKNNNSNNNNDDNNNGYRFVGSPPFFFLVIGLPVIAIVTVSILLGCCCCCKFSWSVVRQRHRQRRQQEAMVNGSPGQFDHNDKYSMPDSSSMGYHQQNAAELPHPQQQVPGASPSTVETGVLPGEASHCAELHGDSGNGIDEPPPRYDSAVKQQGMIDDSQRKY